MSAAEETAALERRWTPRRVQALARRVMWVGLVLSLGYAAWRFEFWRLPEGSAPSLAGVDAGRILVLDRRPAHLGPGEAVLWRTPGGLALGRVSEAPEPLDRWPESWRQALAAGALWIVDERPEQPTPSSAESGPIPRERIHARVLLAW